MGFCARAHCVPCLGKPAITSKTSIKPVSSVGSVGMDIASGIRRLDTVIAKKENIVSEKLNITVLYSKCDGELSV